MVDQHIATAQVLRFSQFSGFAKLDDVARKELTAAMVEAAKTPRHAREIVDVILREQQWCPVVADIYAAGRETFRPEAPPEPRVKCSYCYQTGYRRVYILATWDGERCTKERVTEEQYRALRAIVEGIGVQQVYPMVEVCDCPHGLRLAAIRDMPRDEEPEQRKRRKSAPTAPAFADWDAGKD